MKKNFICMYLFLLATLASCQSCSSDYKDVDDIVVEGVETPVLLGDPFIMLHDGTYYAYSAHADEGIEVYTSDDLKTWKYKGMALQKKDVWADRWFCKTGGLRSEREVLYVLLGRRAYLCGNSRLTCRTIYPK